jgi:hypothetical protein
MTGTAGPPVGLAAADVLVVDAVGSAVVSRSSPPQPASSEPAMAAGRSAVRHLASGRLVRAMAILSTALIGNQRSLLFTTLNTAL